MKAYQEHVLTRDSVSLFMTDNALKEGLKEGREEALNQIIFDAVDQGFSVEIIAGLTRQTTKKVQAILRNRKKSNIS